MRFNFRVKHHKNKLSTVDMQCLECHYQEEIPLDVLSLFFDPDFDENPIIDCPHCSTTAFVPKDIYDQITQNFRYTFRDK